MNNRMNTDKIELGDVFTESFNLDDCGEDRTYTYKVVKATNCTITLEDNRGKMHKVFPYQIPGIDNVIFAKCGIMRSARFEIPTERQ